MTARISATRAAQVTFGLLLAASLALLVAVALPLWKPLFIAAVLAAALTPWNERLARLLGGRRRIATALTTVLLVLIVLIPITILAVIAVSEAVSAFQFVRATLEHGGVDELVGTLPKHVEEAVRRILALVPQDVKTLSDQAAVGGKVAAGVISGAFKTLGSLAFSLVMMLIAFYALLLEGHRLFGWIRRVSPLPETGELLDQARRVSGYVLRSSFLTALAQGVLATVGYIIASVPNPVFFGMLTFFTAFIPSVGTSLVALPLTALLALSGQTWQPIFLAVWSLGIVGTIDNLLRPLLIRGEMHLDGVLLFFALIGGILVFGGIGVLVGPLALTFFLAMVRFAYRDYVQPPRPDAMPQEPAV